jgi:Fe-S oxidoreductase
MLRSETSFNLWQSILRGAGVITGCRRCEDVCPVGADYQAMLADALDKIPEDTTGKQTRRAEMARAEAAGKLPRDYGDQARWIGRLGAEEGKP